MSIAKLLPELAARHELIANFVNRNLKQRYKGSFFGFMWSLLHPLFLVLTYFAFVRLMRFQMDLPYLIVGVLVWQFFALACGDSVNTIQGNASLIKKSYFPRIILPLSTVMANLVHFLLSLIVLAAFLAAYRVWPTFEYVHLVWIIALQFLFCLGMALLLSSLNVFYRDVEHLLQIVIMAWFFVTPIIYPIDKVIADPGLPGWVLNLYFLNPMASLVVLYRQVFLGTPPISIPIWPGFLVAAALLGTGYYFFQRLETRFTDEL